MNKRVVVYGKTIDNAREKLENILDSMIYGDVYNVKELREYMEVQMKNGDLYTTAIGGESSRGHKWNYAYIDRDIDTSTINEFILPSGIGGDYNYEFYSNDMSEELSRVDMWLYVSGEDKRIDRQILNKNYNVEYRLGNGNFCTFNNTLVGVDKKYYWFLSDDGLDVIEKERIVIMESGPKKHKNKKLGM